VMGSPDGWIGDDAAEPRQVVVQLVRYSPTV
jgi:hypothetical protein